MNTATLTRLSVCAPSGERTSRSSTARASARRLCGDESGAIVVFGIFFAVMVLGMLYYFVGIAATIHLRERLQDAADASAFAAAVVHARGMNVMALINMIMAAIMSVLVTLRLIEVLILIAEILLYALAWLGGATAAIASGLEVVRQTVSEIAEEAEPIIQNVIKVLHYTGDVIRVVTPLGANLTVMGKVVGNYSQEVPLAVAIPPRLTLPVEDDTYKYLCGKAGTMAATLVLLPFKSVLPSAILEEIEVSAADLTGGGSTWFCGDGDPPETHVKPEVTPFPRSPQSIECTKPDKVDNGQESLGVCREAEEEEGKAQPDPDRGRCRVGQPVCEQQYHEVDGVKTPFEFNKHSYCAETGLTAVVEDAECAMTEVDGRMIPDTNTPYGRRLLKARTDCKPDGKKQNYWWIEREIQVRWDAKLEAWQPVPDGVVVAEHAVHANQDGEHDRLPCDEAVYGRGGERWQSASSEWNSGNLTDPVCKVEPPPPALRGSTTATRREVLQVLGCDQTIKPYDRLAPKPVNLSQDKIRNSVGIGNEDSTAGGPFKGIALDDDQAAESQSATGGEGDMANQHSDEDGGNDMVPFRFEKKHKLGTSDMQIRSLIISHPLDADDLTRGTGGDGENAHEHALRVVEISKWGHTDDGLETLRTAAEGYGRFAVAQAEYYFDVDAEEGEAKPFALWSHKDDENPENGSRDYLWYMGWTARMRRFRLSFDRNGKSADGESQSNAGGSNNDQLMDRFGGLEGKDLKSAAGKKSGPELSSSGPEIPCVGPFKDMCDEIAPLVKSYDSLFLH